MDTYAGYNGPARCWGELFGYDPWGNLLGISGVSTDYNGCSQENLNVGVNTKNQVVGNTYDAAGNLFIAQPGNVQYNYDAENHLVSTAGQTYLYDGDGKRVEKATTGTPPVPNKLYWYGAEDSPVLETDALGNELYRYFRFLGTLVAREEANDWVDHYGVDALGNVRFLYGHNGEMDLSDYYPFGGERAVLSQNNNNTRKFTGKERDSESGLDNFGARYDSSSLGRFMSADIGAFHLDNPQSLNRYTYALNNPLFYVDPDGEDSISPVYHLGYAARTTWIQDRQHLDISAFPAPSRSVEFVNYGRGVGIGQAPYLQTDPDNGAGGCTLGCIYGYHDLSAKTTLTFPSTTMTKAK